MKKVILTFVVTYLISFFLLQTFEKMLEEREQQIDLNQTKLLQEHVHDRFKLFLEVPISIGLIGSEYLSKTGIKNHNYGWYFGKAINFNQDILGVNLIDTNGKLTAVFPIEKNPTTLGRTTQNHHFLQESFAKDEPFWISGPFHLLQGKQGFVIYVPVTKGKNLLGWIAVVITTELFDKKFTLNQFSETYHLNIIDSKSGLRYYSSGIESDQDTKKYASVNIFGREIIILSWRKDASPFKIPWYLQGFVCLILSLAGGFMMKLHLKNKKAKIQLEDICILLQMTSSEALSKLFDIQDKDYKVEIGKNITYLTNLMEQIDLLQIMAQDQEAIQDKQQEFLPLLEKVLIQLEDVIVKKNIHVKYSQEELQKVFIPISSWLLQNTIIHHCLSYGILYSDIGSRISVTHTHNERSQVITFHVSQVPEKNIVADQSHFKRRLDVARKALQIYRGDLFLEYNYSGGMKIKIILPI